MNYKFTVLQGTISNLSSGTHITGHSNSRGGQIRTDNTWTFRINNKPVYFRTKEYLNFSEGDEITAVGAEKNGTFQVTCLRNDTTGAFFEPTITTVYILGGAVVLLGLLTISIIIGIILIPLGGFFIWAAYKGSQAVTLLQTTPPLIR